MNDINPASKNAEEVQHAPYLCPFCSKPADEIEGIFQPNLLVLFHGGPKGCRKILSCTPRTPERRVVAPPMIKLQ